MYLSKKYLNEQVQKRTIFESYDYSQFSQQPSSGFDIFLSYSLPDQYYAKLVFQKLKESGFTVYADFLDKKLSRSNITKHTAEVLAATISKCKSLIYIHSRGAKNSKWCPWEVGLASGLKNFRCGILPLTEEFDSEYERQEYLTLILLLITKLKQKVKIMYSGQMKIQKTTQV